MIRHLTAILLLALPAAELRAEDAESLHTFNFNFEIQPRWTLQLHSRLRTFQNIGAFNQFRLGPVLEIEAAPRLTALAGYYHIRQNTRDTHEVYPAQRLLAGQEFRAIEAAGFTLDARSLVERHVPSRFEDYWRFRNRAWLARKTSFGEVYTGGEALRAQDAWFGRFLAGVEWRLREGLDFAVGYEYRDAASGPGSHVVGTYFEWDAWRRP
jgi:hypothetical protein